MKNIEENYVLANLAKLDLFQIHDYIYFNLQNPIAARNTANGIKSKVLNLKDFPYIGKIYNHKNSNIRFLAFKNYLIFYEIQENEKLVIIKRIIYKKRNLGKFL